MEKLFLKKAVDLQMEQAIENVFKFAHEMADTKTGDITPEQAFKLDGLKEQLSDLIIEQVYDNIEAVRKYFTVVRFDQWGNVSNTYTEELTGLMPLHLMENAEIIKTMNVGDKIEGTDYHIVRVN